MLIIKTNSTNRSRDLTYLYLSFSIHFLFVLSLSSLIFPTRKNMATRLKKRIRECLCCCFREIKIEMQRKNVMLWFYEYGWRKKTLFFTKITDAVLNPPLAAIFELDFLKVLSKRCFVMLDWKKIVKKFLGQN